MQGVTLVEQLLRTHQAYLNRGARGPQARRDIEIDFARLKSAAIQRIDAAATRKTCIEQLLDEPLDPDVRDRAADSLNLNRGG